MVQFHLSTRGHSFYFNNVTKLMGYIIDFDMDCRGKIVISVGSEQFLLGPAQGAASIRPWNSLETA